MATISLDLQMTWPHLYHSLPQLCNAGDTVEKLAQETCTSSDALLTSAYPKSVYSAINEAIAECRRVNDSVNNM